MAEGRISSGTIVNCAVALAARKQIAIGMMMIKKFPAVEEASPVPPPTSSPFSVTGNAAGASGRSCTPARAATLPGPSLPPPTLRARSPQSRDRFPPLPKTAAVRSERL